MVRCNRSSVAVLVGVLALMVAAAPAAAQEYPPGGPDVECSATVVEGGGTVSCTISAGTFQPGSTVNGTATGDTTGNSNANAFGGMTVATVGLAGTLAQSGTYEVHDQTEADVDGSATLAFDIPDDAVGPITFTFTGTAPDGSPVEIVEEGEVRAAPADEGAAEPDEGGLAFTGRQFTRGGGLALLLLSIGAGLLYLARRRRWMHAGT